MYRRSVEEVSFHRDIRSMAFPIPSALGYNNRPRGDIEVGGEVMQVLRKPAFYLYLLLLDPGFCIMMLRATHLTFNLSLHPCDPVASHVPFLTLIAVPYGL